METFTTENLSMTYYPHVAYTFARRNGYSDLAAKSFKVWSINGWADSEHVDSAFDRFEQYASELAGMDCQIWENLPESAKDYYRDRVW